MNAHRQGDLFRNDDDAEERETPTWYPDPDEVRAELHGILAQMRAAKSMPWDDDRTALYRTIFPQMTGCLPDEEGAQLRFDFEKELSRLKLRSWGLRPYLAPARGGTSRGRVPCASSNCAGTSASPRSRFKQGRQEFRNPPRCVMLTKP